MREHNNHGVSLFKIILAVLTLANQRILTSIGHVQQVQMSNEDEDWGDDAEDEDWGDDAGIRAPFCFNWRTLFKLECVHFDWQGIFFVFHQKVLEKTGLATGTWKRPKLVAMQQVVSSRYQHHIVSAALSSYSRSCKRA